MFKAGDQVIQLKRLERGRGVVISCTEDKIEVTFEGQPASVRLRPHELSLCGPPATGGPGTRPVVRPRDPWLTTLEKAAHELRTCDPGCEKAFVKAMKKIEISSLSLGMATAVEIGAVVGPSQDAPYVIELIQRLQRKEEIGKAVDAVGSVWAKARRGAAESYQQRFLRRDTGGERGD